MRTAIRALLFATLVVSLGNEASAQDRFIRIRDFGARLIVNADGSLDVTEHLIIGFSGQWNGIVRDLSLRHNTAQGRAERLDVDVISITDGAGQPLRVEEERRESGWTRSLSIWVPGASDVDREVVIRYRVASAIRFFYANSEAGELDELYWNVTGNAWTMPIDKAHARVVLPAGVTPTQTAVYTGVGGSVATDASVQKSANEVEFTLGRGLAPYEGMTVGVGWPAGHIASRPSLARQRLAEVMLWSPLLLPLIVFVLAFRAWQKRGRDPKEGSFVVRYEPVEGTSPAELGTLVDHVAEMRDITATLVDLAVRGFIRIEEITEKRFLGLGKSTDYIIHIIRKRPEWTSLKPHEQRYLEGLASAAPRDAYRMKVSELTNQFYKSLPKIREAIYDSLVESGYYVHRPDQVKARWTGLAVLCAFAGIGLAILITARAWLIVSPVALGFAGALSSVILLVFSRIMPARTVPGARAREAALGFKEFLERVETERYRKMITSPELFERYLPFAMAFAVEEKWARAFEGIYREPPTWYVGGTGHFSPGGFASSMGEMSSAASSS
ncbi:MAG: DUF2207 domain-containing protein, partial [Gemmatimonadota bacterium]|nr:DUF2207 domain-containing protein [Gemmatimonadota bacterium]